MAISTFSADAVSNFIGILLAVASMYSDAGLEKSSG